MQLEHDGYHDKRTPYWTRATLEAWRSITVPPSER